MSCTLVTPSEAMCARARLSVRSRSAEVGGGTTLKTSARAASFRIPVGSPFASRTIRPPAGSGVFEVMPAMRRATELASPMCSSYRSTNTGVAGVTASMSARVGSGAPGHRCSSQLPPSIHSPWAVRFARSPIRLANSAGVAASFRSTASSCAPPVIRWMWASSKPGMRNRPLASITRVAGPRRRSTSARLPTARIRSPAIATASASGRSASTVHTRALTTMRSARCPSPNDIEPIPPWQATAPTAADSTPAMPAVRRTLQAKEGLLIAADYNPPPEGPMRIRRVVVLAAALALAASPVFAQSQPARARGAMVVSQNVLASEVGAQAIRDGGTAVDAAVATAFVLAVTHPTAGNIGGGGFIVFRPASGAPEAYDFRETAPTGSQPTMFLRMGSTARPGITTATCRWACPAPSPDSTWPGRSTGKLPWKRLVAPAIGLARDGFPVTEGLARSLRSALRPMAALPGLDRAVLEERRPLRGGRRPAGSRTSRARSSASPTRGLPASTRARRRRSSRRRWRRTAA